MKSRVARSAFGKQGVFKWTIWFVTESYPIPNIEGEEIMANLTTTIKKERYFLEVDQKAWIIDCFKNQNFPLEIAEIELTEEKEKVILPSFLAKEITGLKIYTNLSLTKHPFSKWGAKI